MKRWLKDLQKEEGQTTVEFALMTIIVMFLVFMFFQASVSFMTTQYVKYAAFMGARTLAVSDKATAESVVNSYIGSDMKNLRPWAFPTDGVQTVVANEATGSVRIQYSSLFYIPLLGEGAEASGTSGSAAAEAETLRLTVESIIKRDVFQCVGKGFDNRTGSAPNC